MKLATQIKTRIAPIAAEAAVRALRHVPIVVRARTCGAVMMARHTPGEGWRVTVDWSRFRLPRFMVDRSSHTF